MDPIAKWFLVGWFGLVFLVYLLWVWQECKWFKRMDRFVKGGE
ncbi:hypothetical protein pEaSNUABM6_00096 [Erwinia phage pEa_SNUABM_6]|nr:hypothetical protein pEaSNUABM6_00096 [Erwinia phage pEa_SNUABM_6]